MRSGWFRDSHRHSLAARGIKTKRYMKQKYFMAEPEQEAKQKPTRAQLKQEWEEVLAGIRENRIKRLEHRAKVNLGQEEENKEFLAELDEQDRGLKLRLNELTQKIHEMRGLNQYMAEKEYYVSKREQIVDIEARNDELFLEEARLNKRIFGAQSGKAPVSEEEIVEFTVRRQKILDEIHENLAKIAMLRNNS